MTRSHAITLAQQKCPYGCGSNFPFDCGSGPNKQTERCKNIILTRRLALADELAEAVKAFRDDVLNSRGRLEEPCLDNDQTNAVLGQFDETVAAKLAAYEAGKGGGG